jgi:hypothetical protein
MSFLDTLKKQAERIENSRNEGPKVEAPVTVAPESRPVELRPITEDLPPLEATITIDEQRGRIDISYNRKPTEGILDALKVAGFRWHYVDRVWYHRDSHANRIVANRLTGADIDPGPIEKQMPIIEVRDTAPSVRGPEIQTLKAIEAPPESAFDRYRSHVEAIISYTGLSPADLQLLAWKVLYDKIFGNPNGVYTRNDIERWKQSLN